MRGMLETLIHQIQAEILEPVSQVAVSGEDLPVHGAVLTEADSGYLWQRATEIQHYLNLLQRYPLPGEDCLDLRAFCQDLMLEWCQSESEQPLRRVRGGRCEIRGSRYWLRQALRAVAVRLTQRGGQTKGLSIELGLYRSRARMVMISLRGADSTPPARATTGILSWRLTQAVLVEHRAQYSEADNASEICTVLSFPFTDKRQGHQGPPLFRWLRGLAR